MWTHHWPDTDADIERRCKTLVEWCCWHDVHPNYVTLLGMGIAVLLVPVHSFVRSSQRPLAGPLLLLGLVLVRQFLDVLDGSIARACDRKSELGGALDTVADCLFFAATIYVYLTEFSRLSKRAKAIISCGLPLAYIVTVYLMISPKYIHDHEASKMPSNTGLFAVAANNVILLGLFLYLPIFTLLVLRSLQRQSSL